MSKKTAVIIALIIALIIIALIAVAVLRQNNSQSPSKQELLQKLELLKSEYDAAKADGYDVSEAEKLGLEARQALDNRDYKTADILLNKISGILESMGRTVVPMPTNSSAQEIMEDALTKLSQVKVISQYRYVTDGMNGRTTGDVIKIFKDTKTDFIFQGLIRQNPLPEKCSDLPQAQQSNCKLSGYSYESFGKAISQIKTEMPNIIFGGGFLAEYLDPASRNEITGQTYTKDELWNMALDPGKWGLSKTKDQYQTELAVHFGWIKAGQPYDPKEQMKWYVPDITNPEVKELFLSWAKKQIDIGVDAIWIDGLYGQAYLLEQLTGDMNDPIVKESYDAATYIVDEIHKYGLSKGKYVYVVSWAVVGDYAILLEAPYQAPDLDAVMMTVGAAEINSGKMNENRWDTTITKIKEKFGNTPIFARIDYGTAGSPLGALSSLSNEDAIQFLKTADAYLQQKGVVFIYPIHGGNLGVTGQKGENLSYGKYDWYDSLAPEFGTYETIKELAQGKAQ
ncbi:MAG: hypothetical protein WA139_03690 [Candidatus Aenigmatarchaeota archaeon]